MRHVAQSIISAIYALIAIVLKHLLVVAISYSNSICENIDFLFWGNLIEKGLLIRLVE